MQARTLSRRRLAGAAGAGSALVALAACGQTGGPGTAAQPTGAAQPGPGGTVAAVSGRVMWQARGGQTYAQLADWATTEFKKKFPNVTVEVAAGNTGNLDKTITTLVSGSGPDIIHGWGRLMAQYAGKGVLVNHNELVRAFPQAEISDFVKQQWDGMVIPTTTFRYGVPTYTNLWVLYYNQSLFQQRGQKEPDDTWDHTAYANAMKAMTFEEGGKKVWGGFARVDIPDRQYHVQAFGGHYVDPKDLTKSLLADAPAQQALQWQYDRLHTDKSWAPIADAQRTWQPPDQASGFAQGALATIEDGIHQLQNIGGKMAGGNQWNVMHMPKGPAKRATFVTTDSWGMWKNTKSRDATWEFMKFLISKEYYAQQAAIEGLLPSRRSGFEGWQNVVKPKLQASSPNFNFKVIQDALFTQNYALVDAVYRCQAEAERVQNEALNAILIRGENPPSYLRDVVPQINQAAGSCSASFT